MIDISFIILEYNCLPEIAPCLASLRENAPDTSCEYIVSSNSLYPEKTRQKLIRESPEIHWIFNDKNGGYPYAMNRGIQAAKGEFVVLLNADTRLKSIVGSALEYFRKTPELGLLGPKMVDNKGNYQDSARNFMTPWLAMRRLLARILFRKRVLLEKGFDYDQGQPVDWVIGAFMMAKKSAIEKAGLLDEGYFLYVEDMDWCLRFWKKGFEVHYLPELVVEYAGTRSSSGFLSGMGRPGRHTLIHFKSYMRYLRKFGRQGIRPVGTSPNS